MPDALNRQAVDALVQSAIESLRAGRGVEDDYHLELKRDWPDPATRARQLAGAANACRGATLAYVIGVDDITGAVLVPSRQEPQEWYAQIGRSFDQAVPELLRVQTVYLGDGDESVQVMVFATDEYPYVINVRGENRREVPIRVGTGTESAHRSQIVRMFGPTIQTPPMTVPAGTVTADWRDTPSVVPGSKPPVVKRELELSLYVNLQVFVEHLGSQPAVMPIRQMRGRLRVADRSLSFDVSVEHLGGGLVPVIVGWGDTAPPDPVPPTFGVYAINQHVVATAPGEFTVSVHVDEEGIAPDHALSEQHDVLGSADNIAVDLLVAVAGAGRPEVDRETRSYAKAVQIAKHLLNSIHRSLREGRERAWCFLWRTPEAVEAGLREIVRSELAPWSQVEKCSISHGVLTFNPDLVFGSIAVGDVKYSLDVGSWRRGDVNQLIAFATAFSVGAGLLLNFSSTSLAPSSETVPPLVLTRIAWHVSASVPSAELLFRSQVRQWFADSLSSGLSKPGEFTAATVSS